MPRKKYPSLLTQLEEMRTRLAPVLYVMLLMLTMATGTARAQSFSQPISRDVGPNPNSAATGDFNGDGKPDMAVGLTLGASVNIMLGNGDGSFISSITYNTDQHPEGTAVGDFNKDGKLDVAVGNFSGGPTSAGNISILLGNGDGQFQPAVNYNAGSPIGLTAVDLNSDGNLDLVTVSNNANKVSVLLGNGDGSFQSVAAYPVGTKPGGAAVADFNEDGKLDLAVTSFGNGFGNGDVSILKGNGDGTFQPAVSQPMSSGPATGIAAGDLNMDSNPDLVVMSPTYSVVNVLLGMGDGTFQAPVSYYVGANAASPKIADFNGDAKPDVVVTGDYYASAVVVRSGNGDGTLQPANSYLTQRNANALVVEDFNIDGKPDLGVMNNGLGRINILLNSPVPRGTRGTIINATATVPATGVSVAGFTGFDPSQTASSFTTTIDWGDTTDLKPGTVTADGSGGFNVIGSHTYRKAGTFNVLVQISDNSGNVANAISSAIVVKADQTISFITFPDLTFGIPDFTVPATASSDLGVSFSAAGQCTVTGNIAHLTGAGSCTLTASQSGNAAYNAAVSVNQSFNILKAATATTVAASNATYDGNPHGGTASVTGPGGLNQSLTVSYAGRNATVYGPSTTAPTNVGDYTASASYADEQNYNGSSGSHDYSIVKAAQTITFGLLGTKTYGNPSFNVSATASSGLPVSFSIVSGPATISGNTVTINGAGTVVVRASQPGNSNYNAATAVERSFTVNKATATITLSNLTQIYDGTAKAATVTVNPSGLPVTVSYSRNGTPVTSPTSVGVYNVTATVNDLNYQGSTSNILVINKATPVLTWNTPASIVVGTALSSTQLNAAANVPGTFQYSPSAGIVLAVGTYQLLAIFTPTDLANFNVVSRNVQLIVMPLPLQLILEESGPDPKQAAALDSILFLRDPFTVINAASLPNQLSDRNTRVIVFVRNLQLVPPEVASAVIVNLIASNGETYNIQAEDVRSVPGFNFTQVVFRLPSNLAPGTATIKVKAHGQESNSGTIRIGN